MHTCINFSQIYDISKRTECNSILYIYHYTNLRFVRESVTGRSTEAIQPALKVFFLCIVGLGHYTRQPTDSLEMAL